MEKILLTLTLGACIVLQSCSNGNSNKNYDSRIANAYGIWNVFPESGLDGMDDSDVLEDVHSVMITPGYIVWVDGGEYWNDSAFSVKQEDELSKQYDKRIETSMQIRKIDNVIEHDNGGYELYVNGEVELVVYPDYISIPEFDYESAKVTNKYFPVKVDNSKQPSRKEVERLARWCEKAFRKGTPMSDEIELEVVDLEYDEDDDVYYGDLVLSCYGVSGTLPIGIKKTGLKKDYFANTTDSNETNEILADFVDRANSAKRMEGVTNVLEFQDALADSQKARWKTIDDRLMQIYEDYQYSNYSKSQMDRYNSYVKSTVQPFIAEQGAHFSHPLITEEDRQSSIESNKKFWSNAIKNARNTWVDNNKAEAARRGIRKF